MSEFLQRINELLVWELTLSFILMKKILHVLGVWKGKDCVTIALL